MIFTISIIIGAVLSKIAFSIFGSKWFKGQVGEILLLRQKFGNAADDNARQAILINSGRGTLIFGLLMLLMLLGLSVLLFFPPWIFEWDEPEQLQYFWITSIAATLWWLLFRPRSKTIK